jgi:hypothetical protein
MNRQGPLCFFVEAVTSTGWSGATGSGPSLPASIEWNGGEHRAT